MIYKARDFVDTSQLIQNNYDAYRENDQSPLLLTPKFAEKNVRDFRLKAEPVYFQREVNWLDSSASFIERLVGDLFGEFLTNWEEPLSQLAGFIEDDTNPAIEKPSGHSIFSASVCLMPYINYNLIYVPNWR